MKNLLIILMQILVFSSMLAVGDASSIYRDIGKELIAIRKDFPALQATVYTLLDQVGKLYKITNVAIEDKNKMEALVGENKNSTVALKNENEKLKGEVGKLRLEVEQKNLQFAQSQQRINSLVAENDTLSRKNSDISGEFLNKVKEVVQKDGKIPLSKNDPKNGVAKADDGSYTDA